MKGRKRWAGVWAGAALALAAAGMVGWQGGLLAPGRAVPGVSGESGEAVGLLSMAQHSALKGALAGAKGTRGKIGAGGTKAPSAGGWSIEKMLKNGLDWDGKEGVKSGEDVIMVPPPLVVPKPPLTISINGKGGGKSNGAGEKITQKVLIPVKALEALEDMNRGNKADLSQLRRALGSLKAEDKRTVEREGEQLGALESQIKDTIKGNVMLRKEVWMVHKLPGFPGHRGIPGVDGRPGRSSVIGPGGYSGPAGPPGPNGADGQSGPRGQQGEMGLQGFRGRPGPPGPPGFQGWRGESGVTGGNGPMGAVGRAGQRGMPGRQGPHGPQGSPGLNGAWEVVKRVNQKRIARNLRGAEANLWRQHDQEGAAKR